jgi:hypothetical protein
MYNPFERVPKLALSFQPSPILEMCFCFLLSECYQTGNISVDPRSSACDPCVLAIYIDFQQGGSDEFTVLRR